MIEYAQHNKQQNEACLMTPNPLNLVWIDLEMTGLNTATDVIIEVATLVTKPDLQVLGEGPTLAIYQPETVLDQMDEWNLRHHTASGLLDAVRASTMTCHEAEVRTLKFLQQYAVVGKSPMCGSSVCQDRRFLARLMPELQAFFHYRSVDVSTLKELAVRWKPEIVDGMQKKSTHRAMDDIRDSVDNLKMYREKMLKV